MIYVKAEALKEIKNVEGAVKKVKPHRIDIASNYPPSVF
jgi:hypothetical protein